MLIVCLKKNVYLTSSFIIQFNSILWFYISPLVSLPFLFVILSAQFWRHHNIYSYSQRNQIWLFSWEWIMSLYLNYFVYLLHTLPFIVALSGNARAWGMWACSLFSFINLNAGFLRTSRWCLVCIYRLSLHCHS